MGRVWRLCAGVGRIWGRTWGKLMQGVFVGFLWSLCACGVRSRCGVGVGLCLWLNISLCVGLSGCGVCSCVGGARLCALWGVYSALWLWRVVSVMRCALMPCEEMRGRWARSGSLGEWRERSTRGEVARGSERDGRRDGERVYPPLLNAHADFGRVTPSHRNYKYF